MNAVLPCQGFESWARGLRLETIAANVKGSEEYHHMRNSDVPCSKEGTPFRYIQEASDLLHEKRN